MKLHDLKKGVRVKYSAKAHRTFKCDNRIHIVKSVDGACAVLSDKIYMVSSSPEHSYTIAG